jgi:hypothetical protein
MAIRSQIAGWNGNPSDEECAEGGVFSGKGLFDWRSIGDYLDCLERNKTATNVAMLVPQVSDTPCTEDDLIGHVGEFAALSLWSIRYPR